MKRVTLSVVVVLAASALAVGVHALAAPAAGATLGNLMAAYDGESNAHARYLAFAEKADKEGYADVACLFRAAAKAEEIHASAHAAVIRTLGGTPRADVKLPDVKTTRENLEAAIKGETYERDTMYPQFLAEARKEALTDAIQTFTYAKTAENEHAKLYTLALKRIETASTVKEAKQVTAGGPKIKGYWVCTVCGYTVPQITFAKCPSCFNPKDKYVQVM